MCEIKDYSQVVAQTKEYILYPTTKVCYSMLPFPTGVIDGRFGFDLKKKQYKTLSIYRRLLFIYRQFLLHFDSDETDLFKTLNIQLNQNGVIIINNYRYDYEFDEEAVKLFIRDIVNSNLDRGNDLNPILVNGDKILLDEDFNYMSISSTSIDNRTSCILEYYGDVTSEFKDLSTYLGPEYMSVIPIYSQDTEKEQNVDIDFKSYFKDILLPQKKGMNTIDIFRNLELKKA